MFCAYTRPRYQVSISRTIGPLVSPKLLACCIFFSIHWLLHLVMHMSKNSQTDVKAHLMIRYFKWGPFKRFLNT